jgi:hypothetical protein
VVKRYAEGTTVPVDRSRSEVMALLQKHGVTAMGWQRLPDGADAIGFAIKGQQYRFTVTAPTTDEMKARITRETPLRYVAYDQWPRLVDAETRRRWRAAILLMKAKFEAIAGDDTTLARGLPLEGHPPLPRPLPWAHGRPCAKTSLERGRGWDGRPAPVHPTAVQQRWAGYGQGLGSARCLECKAALTPPRRKFCSERCSMRWHNGLRPGVSA